MKTSRQLWLLLFLALSTALSLRMVHGPVNRTPVCDPALLKPDERCLSQLPSQDPTVVWVDARTRLLWQQNGLEGSILWNLDSGEDMQRMEAEAVPAIAAASLVVVYCGDEHCGVSRQVADRIRALGLAPEVVVLQGGWRALSAAGRTSQR